MPVCGWRHHAFHHLRASRRPSATQGHVDQGCQEREPRREQDSTTTEAQDEDAVRRMPQGRGAGGEAHPAPDRGTPAEAERDAD